MHGKDQSFNMTVQIEIPRVTVNQVMKEVWSLNLIQNESVMVFGGINSWREKDKEYFSGLLIETKKYEF